MSRTAKALEFEEEFKDKLIKLIAELFLEEIDSRHTVVQYADNDDIKILKFRDPKFKGEFYGVGIILGEVCQIYNGHTGYGVRALSTKARYAKTSDLIFLLKTLEDKFCEYLKNS
jgi:hypothetical protein